jgi:two-component system, LytTR family, response regulator
MVVAWRLLLKSLRVLVIDDEPPARRKLISMLRGEKGIKVIGEASNGPDAVAAIEEQKPDVIFLDIQMPGLNGFEVLDKIGVDNIPLVVFVTAFDQHAVRAFDVNAVDYLLKPFDRERLRKCLDRIHHQRDSWRARVEQLLLDLRPPEHVDRLMVKSQGRVLFLRVEEIDWVEASGNYVELHVGKQTFLLRETVGGLESKLDPKRFPRIHRTTIVNVDRIQELQPWSHGDFTVVLRDGSRLRMSRRYRANLP